MARRKELPPIPTHYTRTIASREYTASMDGGDRLLLLEIGEPIQDVTTVSGENSDWRCPIRWTCEGNVQEGHALGVDSLQALRLGISRARMALEAFTAQHGATLRRYGAVVSVTREDWLADS